MEITALFRNNGEDTPFPIDVSDEITKLLESLDARPIVEANRKFASIYLDWSGPVIMYHVPLGCLKLGVSQLIEVAHESTKLDAIEES